MTCQRIISGRRECADGAGAHAGGGTVSAGRRRRLREGMAPFEPHSPPPRGPEAHSIVHHQRDGRRARAARGQRPLDKRVPRWAAEGKIGCPAQLLRDLCHHPRGPTVHRICCAVKELGRGLHMGPKSGFIRREKVERAVFWQAMLGRGMERARDEEMMAGGRSTQALHRGCRQCSRGVTRGAVLRIKDPAP